MTVVLMAAKMADYLVVALVERLAVLKVVWKAVKTVDWMVGQMVV